MCKEEMTMLQGEMSASLPVKKSMMLKLKLCTTHATAFTAHHFPVPYFWRESYVGHLIIYLLSPEAGEARTIWTLNTLKMQ